MVWSKKWQVGGIPQEYEKQWIAIFSNSREGIFLASGCPICGEKKLRRYYQLGGKPKNIKINQNRFVGFGGEWQWCASCLHYEHSSALVPEWWKADIEVDGMKLSPCPDELEKVISSQ